MPAGYPAAAGHKGGRAQEDSMKRFWSLKRRDGNKFVEISRFEADGPKQAVVKAGFDAPIYTTIYSRIGFKHYAGIIYIYAAETVAAGAAVDFVLQTVS